MQVVVKGRHCEVSDRFREQAAEKLARLEKYDHRVIRIDVEVSKERNPRLADRSYRVELTVHSRGPVVRAEAAAEDKLSALDLVVDRIQARLRKVADRRRVHHGSRTPVSLGQAMASGLGGNGVLSTDDTGGSDAAEESVPVRQMSTITVVGDGPMEVREKVHQARPMSLDQALYEMELVGHDFYLFVDETSGAPSVVYRRHGFDYGVIRLSLTG